MTDPKRAQRLRRLVALLGVVAVATPACADTPDTSTSNTTPDAAVESEAIPGGVIQVLNAYGVPLRVVGLDVEQMTGRDRSNLTLDGWGNADEGIVAPGHINEHHMMGDPAPEHCLKYPLVAYDPLGTEVARLEPGVCTGQDHYRWTIENPEPDRGHVVVENYTGNPLQIRGEFAGEPTNPDPDTPSPVPSTNLYFDPYIDVEYGDAGSGGPSLRIRAGTAPDHCLAFPLVAWDTTGTGVVEVARLDPPLCTPDGNYHWVIGTPDTTTTTG